MCIRDSFRGKRAKAAQRRRAKLDAVLVCVDAVALGPRVACLHILPYTGCTLCTAFCATAAAHCVLLHAVYGFCATALLCCCCTLCTACSCKRMLQMTNWAALALRLRVQRYRCFRNRAAWPPKPLSLARHAISLVSYRPLAPGRHADLPSGPSPPQKCRTVAKIATGWSTQLQKASPGQ